MSVDAQGGDDVFGDAAVAGVCHHMNTDHAEDSLVIAKALGDRPDATGAAMTGYDAATAIFDVTVPEGIVEMRFPWDRPIENRTDVRMAVVAMLREAQARLGLTP
ncbi:DUF2470 domain-containing protein [Gordonia aurantiaca]|uniref:DUF2470 domain-containing protein n=1 Tax=Gordonia sp. B21 TaxID=3151852 RepID=UPI003267BE60